MFERLLISIIILANSGYPPNTVQTADQCAKEFPKDFLFGVSSSSHQIEGAWNEGGKVESNWDRFIHTMPKYVVDGSNADVSSDSYHKTEEDVGLLKHLGVDFYRFSLAWPRILPTPNKINAEGVRYYDNLIDLLVKNDIKPLVTLFHWDFPQRVQDLGGFTNPEIVDLFVQYANVAFARFGDRVKEWMTFNEPFVFCKYGHGEDLCAPALNQSGIAEYMCGHNVLKAHARVYHLYNDKYRPLQHGNISFNVVGMWAEPASNTAKDIAAAERFMEFETGWFANPVFGKKGDYPPVMKELVAKHSKLEGYPRSRLPTFTKQEVEYIRGTSDYLYLNHYSTKKVTTLKTTSTNSTSYENDSECDAYFDTSFVNTTSPLFKVVPWGFTKILVYIKQKYNNPTIYITENGYPDSGDLIDTKRVSTIKQFLNALLEAKCNHDVNVKGYSLWSFMDSFEWFNGFTLKFGLYHVNFTDPSRPRTPKISAEYYKRLISTRKL